MNGKKKFSLKSAFSAVVFLLVIFLAVGFIFRYTNAGDKITDIFDTTFRIEYDGTTYKSTENKILVRCGQRAKFAVKGCESYKIQVTPNVTPETDFTYSVNGQEYLYSTEDLTGLIIKPDDIFYDCFYIDSTKNSLLLQDVLSYVWGGEEVTLNGTVAYPYKITVTSNNGEIINLIVACAVVEIEPEHIIF